MPFDSNIHHRRSIRLKGYDYSQAGLYFITICCENRISRFGKVINGEMILNEFGEIAYNEWGNLALRFTNFELDVFQIMPNHIHGIIALNNLGATFSVTQNAVAQNGGNENLVVGCNIGAIGVALGAGASPAPTNASVSDIVGAYKSLVANGSLKIYKSRNEIMGKFWQRNYYEIIIRNELSYENISAYIVNNPIKWNGDKFNNK